MKNREIKFRTKNKTTNEWYYFNLKQLFELGEIEKWEWFKDWGEYTGLKDKKRTKEYPEGQEIYEGDIVRTDNFNGVHTFIVKYENEYCGSLGAFVFRNDGRISSVHCEATKICEIIGNIYENNKR